MIAIYLYPSDKTNISDRTLVATTGTSIMVPYLSVKSLQEISFPSVWSLNEL